jgi:DNA (cytosine-5)-methyltransferase 1
MLDKSNQVSSYIVAKRVGMGLNQREFAHLLGLGDGGERTVGGWERGEHAPSRAKMQSIEALPDLIPFRRVANGNGRSAFDFIDLFAGIGGIRLPFQEAGGRCVFTSEWDKFAQKTYAANFGEVPEGDITKIAAECIPSLARHFPKQD